MIRPRTHRPGLRIPAVVNKKEVGPLLAPADLLVPADLGRNCGGIAEKCYFPPSAHFPKFVLHRGTNFHELRKVMGTSKHIDSSAAFLDRIRQELQIGGTGLTGFFRRLP